LRSEAVQGVSAFALLDLNPLADDFEALLRGFAELLLARPKPPRAMMDRPILGGCDGKPSNEVARLSLDHLVGAAEKRKRNGEPERLSGF
jgi:hypothetical protein